MGSERVIGVAGATGALGKEIVAVLDAAPWRPARIAPFASRGTAVSVVPWGDESIAVDDLAHADLANLDALIVALPPDVARPVVDEAARSGTPVVDCSGSQFENLDVPLILPWVNGDAVDAPRARDVVAIPGAIANALAAVLNPLREEGFDGDVSATALVPASHWGRSGIDELSKQVVALFNSGTPPRKVFEQGLAFDLLPAVGQPGVTGWTGPELRAMTELARLTGLTSDITLIGVPLFTGLSLEVRIEAEAELSPERVQTLLTNAGISVGTGRKLPRPRKVDGTPFPQVGRIRGAPRGGDIHLWIAADNLRSTAAAAVGVAARILRAELED